MTLGEELMRGPKLGESKEEQAKRLYAMGGWTQRRLALHLGVSTGSLSRWVKGMKVPTFAEWLNR